MPFFNENMEIFESKMDQIDIDVMQKQKNKKFIISFIFILFS